MYSRDFKKQHLIQLGDAFVRSFWNIFGDSEEIKHVGIVFIFKVSEQARLFLQEPPICIKVCLNGPFNLFMMITL